MPLFGVHAERRRLLLVERAEPDEPPARTLEAGVLTDEGDDVGCRPAPWRRLLLGSPRCTKVVRGTDSRAAGVQVQLAGPSRRVSPSCLGGTGLGGLALAALPEARAAWAAASLAIGTRNGEQLT